MLGPGLATPRRGRAAGPAARRMGDARVMPRGGGFDSRPVHVSTSRWPVRAYELRTITGQPDDPSRGLLECCLCMDADPDRVAGHVVVHRDPAQAERLMRNHLAQRHDVLPEAPHLTREP